MNGLLVRGPSEALSSSRMLITLPRSGILSGLRKKHASPGCLLASLCLLGSLCLFARQTIDNDHRSIWEKRHNGTPAQ
jgi:hypothetical protein